MMTREEYGFIVKILTSDTAKKRNLRHEPIPEVSLREATGVKDNSCFSINITRRIEARMLIKLVKTRTTR